MPLSTLHGAPRDDPRKTRGQDGSLLLSCKTLAFSTFCRFSPAHRLSPFRTEVAVRAAGRLKSSPRALLLCFCSLLISPHSCRVLPFCLTPVFGTAPNSSWSVPFWLRGNERSRRCCASWGWGARSVFRTTIAY